MLGKLRSRNQRFAQKVGVYILSSFGQVKFLQVLRGVRKFYHCTGLYRIIPPPLILVASKCLYSLIAAKEDVVLVDTPGGKMYLNIGTKYWRKSMLLLAGCIDRSETELFKRVVKEGMTVIDVGANIGYYTLLAAKLVGKNGKVSAFEPEPNNFALLIKNIKENGIYDNVIPVQKALADKKGISNLFLAKTPDRHSLFDSSEAEGSIKVEVITLDSFWESEGCPPVHVIKMDIEGAEMAALKGMTKVISENPELKIMTEFYPKKLAAAGVSPVEFLNKLKELGFKLYAISSQPPWIKPISIADAMKSVKGKSLINLFCAKNA